MRPENVAKDLRREPDDLYPLVELIERWDTQLRVIRGNVAEAGADDCLENILAEMRELVRGML